MGLTSDREVHELLLIEEADAWFEYADATKDQRRLALRRDRAVGLGAAPAAAPGRSRRGARRLAAGDRGCLSDETAAVRPTATLRVRPCRCFP